MRSGVVVPTTMRSSIDGSMPAESSAASAARSARSQVDSASSMMWRRLIPVRSRIHVSLVSTFAASSAFVTTRSGRLEPVPTILG